MLELSEILLGSLAAFFATLIGSFAGGGSSLIMFPLLMMVTPLGYASLLATTKVGGTAMTLVASKMHFRKRVFENDLDYFLLLVVIFAAILGTGFGTYLVQYKFNEELFRSVLAITLLSTATYLFFTGQAGIEKVGSGFFRKRHYFLTFFFCLFLNVLNGLFGGAGIFTTVFLVLFLKKSFVEAVGYTMFSYFLVNFLQSVYLVLTEEVNFWLTFFVLFSSFLGSFIGTKLHFFKGNKWVKFSSILLMTIIGVSMFL